MNENERHKRVSKWYNYTYNVDIDTGEILHKSVLKNYFKIKSHKNYEFREEIKTGERYGICTTTHEWRHNGQTELF